jgi:hypothetical protein
MTRGETAEFEKATGAAEQETRDDHAILQDFGYIRSRRPRTRAIGGPRGDQPERIKRD